MKWIPISEKEPPKYKNILVTWKYGCKRYVMQAQRVTRNAVTFYEPSADFQKQSYSPLNVIAWAEMPEPYKGN